MGTNWTHFNLLQYIWKTWPKIWLLSYGFYLQSGLVSCDSLSPFFIPYSKRQIGKRDMYVVCRWSFRKGGSKKKYLWTYYIVSLVFSLRASAGSSKSLQFFVVVSSILSKKSRQKVVCKSSDIEKNFINRASFGIESLSSLVSPSFFYCCGITALRKVCWCAAIHIVISSSLHRHFSIRAVGGFRYPEETN